MSLNGDLPLPSRRRSPILWADRLLLAGETRGTPRVRPIEPTTVRPCRCDARQGAEERRLHTTLYVLHFSYSPSVAVGLRFRATRTLVPRRRPAPPALHALPLEMRRRDATLAQSPWRIVHGFGMSGRPNMTRCRDSQLLLMPAVTLLAVLGAQPQLDESGSMRPRLLSGVAFLISLDPSLNISGINNSSSGRGRYRLWKVTSQSIYRSTRPTGPRPPGQLSHVKDGAQKRQPRRKSSGQAPELESFCICLACVGVYSLFLPPSPSCTFDAKQPLPSIPFLTGPAAWRQGWVAFFGSTLHWRPSP